MSRANLFLGVAYFVSALSAFGRSLPPSILLVLAFLETGLLALCSSFPSHHPSTLILHLLMLCHGGTVDRANCVFSETSLKPRD